MPRLLFKLKNSRTTGRNGKFNFDVALSMTDREETFSSDEEFLTINLLSKIAIEKYKKKHSAGHRRQRSRALMASGILIVDKPEDWTSQDVVAKLRGGL